MSESPLCGSAPVRKVTVDPEIAKSEPEVSSTPFFLSIRLETGAGILARVKIAFEPLAVPPGISASMNVAPLVPDAALATSVLTVDCRLETVLLMLPTVVLKLPTVEVTVFKELEMAFRYELRPVTCPMPRVADVVVVVVLGTVDRTWLRFNGEALGPTCQVSTQLVRPSPLVYTAR